MKDLGLVGYKQPSERIKLCGYKRIAIPNHFERQFAVMELNQLWCSDMTCIWIGKRWPYFAVVLAGQQAHHESAGNGMDKPH